jgi:hypothetical protein
MPTEKCTITSAADSPTELPNAGFQSAEFGATFYPGANSDAAGFVPDRDPSDAVLDAAKAACDRAIDTITECLSGGAEGYSDAEFSDPGGAHDWGNATTAVRTTPGYVTQYNIFGEGAEQMLVHSTSGEAEGPCGFVQQNVMNVASKVARCIIDRSSPPEGCLAPDTGGSFDGSGSLGGGSGSLGEGSGSFDGSGSLDGVVAGATSEAAQEEGGVNLFVAVAAAAAVDAALLNGRVSKTVWGTFKGVGKLLCSPCETGSRIVRDTCTVLSDPNRYAYEAVTTLANDVRGSLIGRGVRAAGRGLSHACGYGTEAVAPAVTDTEAVSVVVDRQRPHQPPAPPTSHAARVAPEGATNVVPSGSSTDTPTTAPPVPSSRGR